MIKNIIFDFGDIFINLDKEIVFRKILKYGNATLAPEVLALSSAFEVGTITPETFIKRLNTIFPKTFRITVWIFWKVWLMKMNTVCSY